MRKISLVLSLILFSLVLFISCESTEPVESQPPVEPPAEPNTVLRESCPLSKKPGTRLASATNRCISGGPY